MHLQLPVDPLVLSWAAHMARACDQCCSQFRSSKLVCTLPCLRASLQAAVSCQLPWLSIPAPSLARVKDAHAGCWSCCSPQQPSSLCSVSLCLTWTRRQCLRGPNWFTRRSPSLRSKGFGSHPGSAPAIKSSVLLQCLPFPNQESAVSNQTRSCGGHRVEGVWCVWTLADITGSWSLVLHMLIVTIQQKQLLFNANPTLSYCV